MKIIGITGPIGSGKSYVSERLLAKGIPVIDSDKVYHSLIAAPSPLVDALVLEFGDSIVNSHGGIDRRRLAPIVFGDAERLARLNEITHTAVLCALREQTQAYEQEGTSLLAVQVPLMFESGYDASCDTVICVVADDEVRVQRICSRDSCSADEAKKRIKNQKDTSFYIANSAKTVYNNGGEDIDAQLDRILGEILEKRT